MFVGVAQYIKSNMPFMHLFRFKLVSLEVELGNEFCQFSFDVFRCAPMHFTKTGRDTFVLWHNRPRFIYCSAAACDRFCRLVAVVHRFHFKKHKIRGRCIFSSPLIWFTISLNQLMDIPLAPIREPDYAAKPVRSSHLSSFRGVTRIRRVGSRYFWYCCALSRRHLWMYECMNMWAYECVLGQRPPVVVSRKATQKQPQPMSLSDLMCLPYLFRQTPSNYAQDNVVAHLALRAVHK